MIDYVTQVGPSHQQKGEQVRTDRAGAPIVSSRSPARDVLGSAKALSWGPLAGWGVTCCPALCWGSGRALSLASHVMKV